MIRRISGLISARALRAKPGCIPNSRPRGAKAKGLQYERTLAKRLPWAEHGKWFEFEDVNGHGFCQPDFLLEAPLGQIVILEVKYTWTPEAEFQLEKLYRPVVEKALGKPAIGVTVCKRLIPGMPKTLVLGDLWAAISRARAGMRPVFHWLGKEPILSPAVLDLAA